MKVDPDPEAHCRLSSIGKEVAPVLGIPSFPFRTEVSDDISVAKSNSKDPGRGPNSRQIATSIGFSIVLVLA